MAKSPTIVNATALPVPMELLTVILVSARRNNSIYLGFELASPALYTPLTLVLPFAAAIIVKLLVLNCSPRSLAKELVWLNCGLQSKEFVVWLLPSENTIKIVSFCALAGICSRPTIVRWSIGMPWAARRANAAGYVLSIEALSAEVNGPFVKIVILGAFNATAFSAFEMTSGVFPTHPKELLRCSYYN